VPPPPAGATIQGDVFVGVTSGLNGVSFVGMADFVRDCLV
jgi:hypothetical protein